MRFRGLDLNLLVALDALLTEANVSKAAQRLGLSQSATSNALQRLRLHFRDDLLVQIGRAMALTPLGNALLPGVRAVLMQIEAQVMSPTKFDAATSDRRVSIMASDYVTMVALHHGLSAIGRQAPRMRFEILPVSELPARSIEHGEIDLLIMPDVYVSAGHPKDVYFTDRYVCVVDASNRRVGNSLKFEQYLALRHVVVRFARGRQPTFEERFVERHGQTRNVDVIVPSFSAAPFFVAGTDRIATMHKRHAELAAASLGLRIVPLPTEIPPVTEVIQWHRMNNGDEALAWVRGALLLHQGEDRLQARKLAHRAKSRSHR